MNRVRAAPLRLSPPWRRRHPVVLAPGETIFIGPRSIRTTTDGIRYQLTSQKNWVWVPDSPSLTDAAALAERDPTDEAGA